MKNLRKPLAILLTLCLLLGAMCSIPFTAAATEYKTYELYDYLAKIAAKHDSGTEIVNDTPWALQVKAVDLPGKFPADWESFSFTTSREVDGYDYVYLFSDNSDRQWGNYPGFAFWHPQTLPDRYYINIATPTNSVWDASWRANVAYAFTAPTDGVYQVQPADQNKVQSFDWCNWFAPHDGGNISDFGVRVTVDDKTVWPSDDLSYASDGWAVFGNGEKSTVTSIPVPTVSDIKLKEGQVLRVEFTNFTALDDASWSQRIHGSFAVKHTGDLPVDQPIPEQSEMPIRYEIYDYLTAYATNSGAYSPWNVQVNKNGDGWNAVDAFYNDGDYKYIHWTPYEWGGNWPGVKFYYPTTLPSDNRYYFSFLTPTYCWGNQTDVAYTFTAPYTGNYNLGKADQDKVLSFDSMNNFGFREGVSAGHTKELNNGVRITVDGKTVWPTADHPDYYNGYARFTSNTKVEVPEFDMFLTKDSVVRVEFRAFDVYEQDPWNLECAGLVAITLKDIEGTADAAAREIEDLGLYSAELDATVTESCTVSAGASVTNKDVATLKNDTVKLAVKAFSQNVKLSLNGIDFLLNGENSAISAGENSVAIAVAEDEDGIYEISYKVVPVFAANVITATAVKLVVNGVEYTANFDGVAPANGKNALTVANLSEDDIVIMPGALEAKNAKFKVVGDVLYVGATTDLAAVKAGIANAGKYAFFGETAVTGDMFMRNGRDDVIYSIAVAGDNNGDGACNVIDLVRTKKASAGSLELDAAQIVASTLGEGGEIAAEEIVAVRKYILG